LGNVGILQSACLCPEFLQVTIIFTINFGILGIIYPSL